MVEEHDSFLTGIFLMEFISKDEEQLPIEKNNNAPPFIVYAKTGTIISTPTAKSTIIALPTANFFVPRLVILVCDS